MKSIGIVRQLDELGRVVIPKEIRDTFNLKIKDKMEIYIDRNTIVLKKMQRNCYICNNEKNLREFNDKFICEDCIKSISEIIRTDITNDSSK